VEVASRVHSLALFVAGFVALFVLSGIGNGSTYKLIPAVFRGQAARAVAAGADPEVTGRRALRLTGAVIGIAGAVGAFGGVLVNLAFRQSFLATGSGEGAYLGFLAFYAVCVALTWSVYVRPGGRGAGA
jgi:NNP family nitrate/nitrite transporter-like MFS transporter